MGLRETTHSWRTGLQAFLHPRVITMLLLGFSAGVPLLLIFSSLGLWLREAGIERSAVTYFSWAALGYSFKFLWAPLVDQLPLPWLTRRLGRRRAWMLSAQFAIMFAIWAMGATDPAGGTENLDLMAIAAVMLGFSAATQDIVIDAYRIESAGNELQAMMSSSYIAGYRIGMLTSGAGALYLASDFGSELGSYDYEAWRLTYHMMALVMLVGLCTTLFISEPEGNTRQADDRSAREYVGFLAMFVIAVAGLILTFQLSSDLAAQGKALLTDLTGNSALGGFLVELTRLALGAAVALALAWGSISSGIADREIAVDTYLVPVRDFFHRYGRNIAWLLLALIGLYRISDIVLGVIANVFFQDMGFSKQEIATIVKTFGLVMTILGGFLGGVLSIRFGVMRILFLGAVLTILTNLLFMLLAFAGHNTGLLYLVISADNLSAGLASAAFVAFLSRLTNISFTAVQYAIFSSLMTLIPKIIGGYSGSMVDGLGYSSFFLIASLMGVPVLWLIWIANKHLQFD